jgi:hypothetical protein
MPRGVFECIASKLAPARGLKLHPAFERGSKSAYELACQRIDDAVSLMPRGVFECIASKLAPTRGLKPHPAFERGSKSA